MDLIRKVWAGEEVDAAELQDAVPFKGFSLLSEEKQLCIFSEVYHRVRSEADLRNALALLEKNLVPGEGRAVQLSAEEDRR